MKKIETFVKNYGTRGASLILLQAAKIVRGDDLAGEGTREEIADEVEKIAEELREAFEEGV